MPKLKDFYVTRANKLRIKIAKNNDFVVEKSYLVNEYLKLIKEATELVESITNDESLEPTAKYLKITSEVKVVEQISKSLEDTMRVMTDSTMKLVTEKDVLVENCIKDHPHMDEETVKEELWMIFEN